MKNIKSFGKTCFMFCFIGVSNICSAASLCLDDASFCNDIKIDVPSVSEGGVYSIKVYEYGCGALDKLIDGTLRVKNGIWYINTSKNGVNDTAFTAPEVVVYNPATRSATYNGVVIYSDVSFDVSGVYKKVSCNAASVMGVASGQPDKTQK